MRIEVGWGSPYYFLSEPGQRMDNPHQLNDPGEPQIDVTYGCKKNCESPPVICHVTGFDSSHMYETQQTDPPFLVGDFVIFNGI